MTDDPSLAELDYCYLTTTGRHTGRQHRIEIWFAVGDRTLYLLAGGGDRSDWVRNLMLSPQVALEIGGVKRTTTARVVHDPAEDTLARRVVVEKYATRYHGDLTDWGQTSLPIAIAWDPERAPSRGSSDEPVS